MLLAAASHPVLVAGAGNDSAEGWTALATLSERLACPVWQEPFSARAGFPQDHPRLSGHLPASRAELRETLAGHDVVVVVGAALLRQYPYAPGPLLAPGTRAAVVSDDPEEVRRSPVEVGVVVDPARACQLLAERLEPRVGATNRPAEASADRAARPSPRAGAATLEAAAVLEALGERIPPETIVVEECPSSRADLLRALPARRPMGFLSAAMGGLGFALPAAIGLRMADPARPVVAVVGDGSSLYSFQALWSAVHYRVGVLVVVLSNARYAIMDRLAAAHPGRVPWPSFEEIDLAATARSLGCPARRIAAPAELAAALDEAIPGLENPLLLDVRIE